ncbi:hypothetical protein ABZP36_024904 [Zizania latifolia]
MAVEGSELGFPAAASPAAAQASEDRAVAEVSGTPPARLDLNKVREAKIFAFFQAQYEGCLIPLSSKGDYLA